MRAVTSVRGEGAWARLHLSLCVRLWTPELCVRRSCVIEIKRTHIHTQCIVWSCFNSHTYTFTLRRGVATRVFVSVSRRRDGADLAVDAAVTSLTCRFG